MKPLSDAALQRLRQGAKLPDLSDTHYRLLEQLARGGMGLVYAAEDTRLERRVAIKVIDVPGLNGELADRLLREAKILARLEHPGIVPVHDVGSLVDGRVFYAMKFVEGQGLDKHIAFVPSIPDRLRFFLRICDAVAFAHSRGILHRDLKPGNVMVGPFGEVLVMDWGLAKVLSEAASKANGNATLSSSAFVSQEQASDGRGSANNDDATENGTIMGTPGYMSPEQARGEVDSLDARSDIFSLGVLLHFLITATTPQMTPAPLNRSLKAICSKASATQREARYASVPELAKDVAAYLDGLSVSAYRETFFERAARFYRRYRFFILLILAYLAMRVLILFLFRR